MPFMIADLGNLVALQKSELEIRAIESRLKQIPEEIADLQKEVATERANLKSAEDRWTESQKTRRTLEGEAEVIEARVEKYKDQLMQVKTNDEYRAMQKQIQTAKEELTAKEDKILARMEELESLQELIRQRQKELEAGMAKVKEMEARLEEEATRLKAELEKKTGERDGYLASVPGDLLAQYRQIARIRGGVAVAEAKDEHCQVCHVRLRPQVYSDVRMGERILNCERCSRILYHLGGPPQSGDPR